MPEVTITYEKPEALKALKDLAKRFGLKISADKVKKNNIDDILEPDDKSVQIQFYDKNELNVIPASANTEDLDDVTDIFKDVDAAKLRKEAWQRKL